VKVTRWLWDGNVPLHEWQYEGEYPPGLSIDATGTLQENQEPVENLITWIYEEGSFVPCGKIAGEEEYSIVSDYLGTPTHAFNVKGEKVWERELDVYGAIRKEAGQKGLVPQLYQGQWVDDETGLAYNRFRYYDYGAGNYLSQDPIRLEGGMALYNYVYDSNGWIDVFGLAPGDIALGKDPHFKNLAQQTNSSDWRNWAKDGITRRRVDKNFGRAFNQASKKANHIHFSLDGFDDDIAGAVKKGKAGFVVKTHNMTNAELHTIASNPDLLKKTTFYKNGKPITGVELDDLNEKLKSGCH
jgi:RHS repeat-associated protein